MQHKVKVTVPVQKRTLFGKKTVLEKRTVTVDGATYRKMKKQQRDEPLGLEEMILYDLLSDEPDDD